MDADKIQNFLVYNFEKGIVAIVFLLSGFLVYVGMDKEDITQTHDPDKLKAQATEVRAAVDEDHTTEIVEPRRPEFDIAAEQKKFRSPINSTAYYPEDPFDISKKEAARVRREDPVLAKPVGIQTVGVVASMAYRSSDGNYSLTALEPADPLEVIEEKPKPRERRRGRGMDMMMEMEMEMQMEMDMEMDMGMEDMLGQAPGAVRKLDAANNLGATGKATKAFSNGADQEPVPGPGIFIAGTAAIPHKDLIDAYQEAFSHAPGYDPRLRDRPIYVDYEVQRADITNKSIDELQEEDWITRDNRRKTTINAVQYWAGFAPEIVPADYRSDGTTMWIPPVLLDRYDYFSVNPLIPMKSQRELEQEELLQLAEQNPGETFIDPTKIELDRSGKSSRNFGGGGEYGYDMMDGEMDDMEDYGMDYGSGMMGGVAAGMVGKPAEDNPVDYKLLRFYDFAFIKGARTQDKDAPQLHRTYVYRIRYGVNDPNFPDDETQQPKVRTLASDAYERYSMLAAKAVQTQKRDSTRWSEWSEPSEPTTLASLDQAVVGSVKAEKSRRTKLGDRTIVVESDSPHAEVVASSFDPRYSVFVPTLMDVTEGTVLSKEVESADVVDPITLEVKKLENPTIRAASTVIDIEGGLPLEIVEDEKMLEPGLFLIMDSNGKLHVKDSVEQQRLYRIKSFAKERGL